MIRVIRTFTRPSTSVTWYHQTAEGTAVGEYRNTAYGSKMSNQSLQESPDGLTLTYSVTWASQADFSASRLDTQFKAGQSSRQAYNANNGIIESVQNITQL